MGDMLLARARIYPMEARTINVVAYVEMKEKWSPGPDGDND